jgi:Fn3 domain-containing protein
MSYVDQVDQWQSDVVGRLAGSDYLSDIIIIQERLGTTETEVDEALKTFRAATDPNKKAGVALIVFMPERRKYGAEINLKCDVVVMVRVIEIPKINRKEGGTNKWASGISIEIEDLLHAWTVGSTTFMLEDTIPYNDGEGGVGFTHTFKVLFARKLKSRVGAPNIGIVTGTATLSADVGADIYFTLDGTYPAMGNGATLYLAPFAVGSGIPVRAVAYKTNFQASNVSSLITQ